VTIWNKTGGLSCGVGLTSGVPNSVNAITPADCGCFTQYPAETNPPLTPGAGCDAGSRPDGLDAGDTADVASDAPTEAPSGD
jgi:hypothetical protein